MKVSYFPGCTLRTKAKQLDKYARLSAEALGVTLEEIENEYEEMFVKSKRYINVKLKKCICQALQNRRDLGEKFDPTYLAAPAERALEGHIRYVLAGILTGHFMNVFDVTEKDVNAIVMNGYSTETKTHDFFSTKGNGYIKTTKVEELKDEDFIF